MKKIFLMLALAVVAVTANAEELVGRYMVAGQEMDVEADFNSDGDLVVYFDVFGEYDGEKVMIGIRGEANINAFIEGLQNCRAKYMQWVEIAAQHSVKNYSKFMDFSFPNIRVWWKNSSGDWCCSKENDIVNPKFVVDEDGATCLTISGLEKDVDNEYIEQQWCLSLVYAEDFDSLIEALNPTKLKTALDSTAALDALFQ